jgi:hypothetical protein
MVGARSTAEHAEAQSSMSIRLEPAECWSECQDEFCPYSHQAMWYVTGEDDGQEYGPFYTREEAVACNKLHLLPEEP